MSNAYSILFLGDVVGEPGRNAVREWLPRLQERHQPLFTIVNGENAAGGVGITPKLADFLLAQGADALTLGNHAFHKRDILPYLAGHPIVRPLNLPASTPGRGSLQLEKQGIVLTVANLCGRVGMEPMYDDPFAAFDRLAESVPSPHLLLDFHAEATSEKVAMGYHADGRATAVLGTHTHVTTADERVLPKGTAHISDVGMCGPANSVLGMDRELILRRFRTGLSEKFEVGSENGVISGVLLRVGKDTGRAQAIERISAGGT
jgi:2',3'-cyclic-nucleotide 2'-phosphodiesterase